MVRELKRKYNDLSVPVKASIWFVICGVLKDVIDVLATPVFTRILTTEQYGIYNVYNSWFQIVKIILTLYLFGEVFNVGLVKFQEDRERFVSTTLGFITTIVAVCFILYLIFDRYINKFVGMPGFLVVLLFVHVLVYVPYYCWIRRERFDYNYKKVVFVSGIYILLQPLMAIVAILYMELPLNPGHTRILTAVGVQIIIGFVLYVSMLRQGRCFYDKSYWRYSFKTGIELVPFNLSKVVLNQSDRIMINMYFGAGDTAIYSVAHSAAFVLQAVTEALNGAFVPWLYRKLQAREWSGIKTITNGLIVIVSVCVFGIDIIAPEIMKILGSSDYYEGVYCIPALVYSVYLIFIYTIFSNITLYYGKNIYVTIAATIGMIVNIILNMIFIPQYGIIAAGFTTLVGYLAICIGQYALLKICLKKENIKITDLVDIRTTMFVSIIMLMFTFMCNWLYQYNVVRWSLVVALMIIFIATRHKWLEIIKNLKGDKDNG